MESKNNKKKGRKSARVGNENLHSLGCIWLFNVLFGLKILTWVIYKVLYKSNSIEKGHEVC